MENCFLRNSTIIIIVILLPSSQLSGWDNLNDLALSQKSTYCHDLPSFLCFLDKKVTLASSHPWQYLWISECDRKVLDVFWRLSFFSSKIALKLSCYKFLAKFVCKAVTVEPVTYACDSNVVLFLLMESSITCFMNNCKP